MQLWSLKPTSVITLLTRFSGRLLLVVSSEGCFSAQKELNLNTPTVSLGSCFLHFLSTSAHTFSLQLLFAQLRLNLGVAWQRNWITTRLVKHQVGLRLIMCSWLRCYSNWFWYLKISPPSPQWHSPLHSCVLHYLNVISPPMHARGLTVVIGEGFADIKGNCFRPKHTWKSTSFDLLHPCFKRLAHAFLSLVFSSSCAGLWLILTCGRHEKYYVLFVLFCLIFPLSVKSKSLTPYSTIFLFLVHMMTRWRCFAENLTFYCWSWTSHT